ncbi:MAG TPA: LysR family transcriptional regulator ArgP [Holophaga sp.]|nr:LysR family transcriptional regulator ArgP [Holophaga sp.]
MLDYRLIEAFAAVLEERGFARAAGRLHITQSAVSQRIKQLEDELGRVLIVRETPPRATSAGERLLRHFRQVSGLEEEAIEDLGVSRKGGFRHLPIAVNSDCLSVWLLDALAPFLQEAAITLEIFVADQDSNLHFLQAGTVAGCVSSQRMTIQGFTSTRIGSVRYLMAASPDFRERWFGDGFTREAATRAPAILFNRDDQLHDRALGRVFGRSAVQPPAYYIPSVEKFNEAIVLGLGYGMITEVQALPEIARGALVEIEPKGRLDTALYWYRWSRSSRLLEDFSKVLIGKGRRLLESAEHLV